jgi:hypothetical protein
MRWFPILFASVACLPLVRAPFAFSRFAYTSVKTDTGFEEGTITHLWNKYNAWNGSPPGDRLSWLAHMICFLCWHGLSTGCVVRALHTGTFGYQLDPRQRRPAMRAFYFFLVFVYMHKMPQLNWIEAFRSRDGAFEASTSSFQDNVFPIATALANIICEINYNWRLDPFNHGFPPFDRSFTGIVDTLPVYIPEPHNWYLSTFFHQPKYGCCVLKMQLGINLLGDIILWTGPHFGVEHDGSIWDRTYADHPLYPWERWLGDEIYGSCTGIITKYGGAAYPVLQRHQLLFNNLHEFLRNRVEQVVSVVKAHRMFKKGNFRGGYHHLRPFLVIVGHTLAFELRRYQRFVGYGPWAHH